MEENNSEAVLDELSTGLFGKLKINCDLENNPMKRYYIEEEEEEEEEDLSEDDLLSQMGYGKTEPKINKSKEPETLFSDEDEKSDSLEESILAQMGYLKNEPPKHEPITTPTADLNLVSALKGTRGKEGVSAKERHVTWAPDVYEPYPTYSEFLVKAKGGVGKNKQKGGGKKGGAIDGEGDGGGKGKKKSGGSKKGVEKGKTAGKDKKDKKHGGDKKHSKKRGGGGGSSKYPEFGEF